jgi:hypothetical protein
MGQGAQGTELRANDSRLKTHGKRGKTSRLQDKSVEKLNGLKGLNDARPARLHDRKTARPQDCKTASLQDNSVEELKS